ncbi:MAG: [LysW]-aminoadipate/[LysW]-glutamate kinase [Candidatus Bathyarchaeota archaeon]|nr:MAG: [LysW]-aminoadipate/[LysW]-glutamate kinase [Candidatus Bathyarchaeota archaeon]
MLIVAKSGGKIIEKGLDNALASDIQRVATSNKLVFVHGGGIQVTQIAEKLGKVQKFVISPKGIKSRYTDREMVDIYTMVMTGKLNKQIVTALQHMQAPAIGLSGLDGCLLQAKRKKRLIIINERGRRMAIDGGYTGTIVNVNTKLLDYLIDGGYLPVISPVAISEEFDPLNVDGDRVAAFIAGSLKADKLILLTDVEGVIMNDQVIPKLTLSEAENVLQRIGYGMITKIHAAIQAIKMGVKEVIISSGKGKRPISSAIEHKGGTVIVFE